MNTLFTALISAAAVVYAYNENPIVFSPKNMTYNAGMKIPIEWKDATTGYVNIDLVNVYRNVLEHAYSIAVGVPGGDGKFEWQIPADLKTAVGYRVRVWGSYQPDSQDKNGNSPMFTIFNDIPNAVNNFIVTSPSKSNPCRIDGPCKITWDFPATVNAPAHVDVVLYQVGNPVPLAKLATVNASDKQYIWDVPSDKSLLSQGNVFISVDGSGSPHEAPKMASNMGANSDAFKISEPIPVPVESPEQKAQREQDEKEKEEAEAKKRAQEEEEERKKQEEEEAKKRDEINNNKKKRAQAKNSASNNNQVAISMLVLSAMVALLPIF